MLIVSCVLAGCASSQPITGCGDGPRLPINGRGGAATVPLTPQK
jgi:hypothetical protein